MEYLVKTENDNKAVSEIIKGWGSDILVYENGIKIKDEIEFEIKLCERIMEFSE